MDHAIQNGKSPDIDEHASRIIDSAVSLRKSGLPAHLCYEKAKRQYCMAQGLCRSFSSADYDAFIRRLCGAIGY